MAGFGLVELLSGAGLVVVAALMVLWIRSWLRPHDPAPRDEQLQVAAGPYRGISDQPPSELDVLDADALIALYGLASLMASKDGRVTPDDLSPLREVWDHFGPQKCQEAMDKADEVLAGRPEPAERLARMVTCRQSQELLFGKLLDVAVKQLIAPEESRLLDQLQSLWRLNVTEKPYR